VEHFARLEHAAHFRFEVRCELGQHLGDGPADVILNRTAVNLRTDAVDATETELAIDQVETDRRVVPRGLELGVRPLEAARELRLSLGGGRRKLARARSLERQGAHAPDRAQQVELLAVERRGPFEVESDRSYDAMRDRERYRGSPLGDDHVAA